MLVRKDGIYKNISSKDYGLYQQMGFEKVITEPLPKLEEVAPIEEPVIQEEPIKEVIEEEPIDEMPKPKRNRKNK